MGTSDSHWRPAIASRLSPTARRLAPAYLGAIAAAEISSVFIEPHIGLALYGVLLVALLLHASEERDRLTHNLLLTVAFVPLIRLVAALTSLAGLPLIDWFLLTSLPLLLAVLLAARAIGRPTAVLGLNVWRLPIQLLVSLSGLALGYVEYGIQTTAPFVEAASWAQLWLPALILLIATGLTEELIFHGLLQSAAVAVLGQAGIVYVAVLFAALQTGSRSPSAVLLAFAVALYFGWIVAKTRSIVGVSFAHGLINIMVYLVLPFVSGVTVIHR